VGVVAAASRQGVEIQPVDFNDVSAVDRLAELAGGVGLHAGEDLLVDDMVNASEGLLFHHDNRFDR
jgi:hypothetical protein